MSATPLSALPTLVASYRRHPVPERRLLGLSGKAARGPEIELRQPGLKYRKVNTKFMKLE